MANKEEKMKIKNNTLIKNSILKLTGDTLKLLGTPNLIVKDGNLSRSSSKTQLEVKNLENTKFNIVLTSNRLDSINSQNVDKNTYNNNYYYYCDSKLNKSKKREKSNRNLYNPSYYTSNSDSRPISNNNTSFGNLNIGINIKNEVINNSICSKEKVIHCYFLLN